MFFTITVEAVHGLEFSISGVLEFTRFQVSGSFPIWNFWIRDVQPVYNLGVCWEAEVEILIHFSNTCSGNKVRAEVGGWDQHGWSALPLRVGISHS